MSLKREEIIGLLNVWIRAWNTHNLKDVMTLLHEDIVFENWTSEMVYGKKALQQSWLQWFLVHGNFKFTIEDIFVDEPEQKVLFQWQLEWPSPESDYKGKQEIRRGVDVLHFMDGKIHKKYTYSKTTVIIDSNPVILQAKTPTHY